MSLPTEDIQELADAVSMWRMQEYISISFYTLYVYYLMTTMATEVSIIAPQRWNRGKSLYTVIRYGGLVFIPLQLTRGFRNYITISPMGCKASLVVFDAVRWLVILACDFSLGLCLGAMLQARVLYVVGIISLSCVPPMVPAILDTIANIQYPAEPVSSLDSELGYPCYYVSEEQWAERTVDYVGIVIRSYVSLATTILLVGLGVAGLVTRYKGHEGRLFQVLRRDGGVYYVCLIALKLILAVFYTPNVLKGVELGANPAAVLLTLVNEVIIPIFAQRLLINMRKVVYMGSEPVASKLLFAPLAPEPEDTRDPESFEMTLERSGPSDRKAAGSVFGAQGAEA